MRYQLNQPDVIQETIDGEAVVIHTPTGAYFSLEGTAEHLWNALLSGYTPLEIAAAYTNEGEAASTSLISAVEQFAQQLQDELLLVPADQTTGSLPPASKPFSNPTIQKFTDMQELLLVDPIHEVNPQSGWPRRPESN